MDCVKRTQETHRRNPVIDNLDHQADIASFEDELLSSLSIHDPMKHIQRKGDGQVDCNSCAYYQKHPLSEKDSR